jgi:hypothetical protein
MTTLDIAVNTFFTSAGTDLIGVLFSIPAIFAIIYAIIRPFNK